MASNFGFPAYGGLEKKVFISYKKANEARVSKIAKAIHDIGINVWYDEEGGEGLELGKEWRACISENMTLSSAIIFFISKAFFADFNGFMRTEYNIAQTLNKPRIIIMLDRIAIDEVEPVDHVIWQNVHDEQFVAAYDDRLPIDIAHGIEGNIFDIINNDARDISQLKKDLSEQAARREKAAAIKPETYESDRLINDANVWLEHYSKQHNKSDLDKAVEIFTQISQAYASDYRGWIGLITCVSRTPQTSLKDKVAKMTYYWSFLSDQAKVLSSNQFGDCLSYVYNERLQEINKKYEKATRYSEYLDEYNALKDATSSLDELLSEKALLVDYCYDTYNAIITRLAYCNENLALIEEDAKIEGKKRDAENRLRTIAARKYARLEKGMYILSFVYQLVLAIIAVVLRIKFIDYLDTSTSFAISLAFFISIIAYAVFYGAFRLKRIYGSVLCTSIVLVLFVIGMTAIFLFDKDMSVFTSVGGLSIQMVYVPAVINFILCGMDCKGIETVGGTIGMIVLLIFTTGIAVGSSLTLFLGFIEFAGLLFIDLVTFYEIVVEE